MKRFTGLESPVHAALLSLVLVAAPAWNAGGPPLRLPVEAVFSGVDATASSVWDGALRVPGGGHVHIAIQQVETPEHAAEPVWHVRSRWEVEPGTGRHGFAADLEGMVDWKAGVGHLSGLITDGWNKGTWVVADTRFINGDVAGTLTVLPALAQH